MDSPYTKPGFYGNGGKPRLVPFENTVREAVRVLLLHAGVDPDGPGTRDTPERVSRALKEMTAGYSLSPEAVLGTVFEEGCDEIVLLKGIEFSSLCEHHLVPFTGTATVGYLPSEIDRPPGSPRTYRIVGLSKLARLVDVYAKRLQVQERMTHEIAEALMTHLKPRGAGVIVKARHGCMACRGVRQPGAEMVTSVMLGVFRTEPIARSEFLALSKC